MRRWRIRPPGQGDASRVRHPAYQRDRWLTAYLYSGIVTSLVVTLLFSLDRPISAFEAAAAVHIAVAIAVTGPLLMTDRHIQCAQISLLLILLTGTVALFALVPQHELLALPFFVFAVMGIAVTIRRYLYDWITPG